jgi:PAS domain S-box-containing protein
MLSSDGGRAVFRPESLATRIRWLLAARVAVATVFLGATAATQGRIDSDPDFPLGAVTGLLVAAYLASLGSAAVLERLAHRRSFAYGQIAADIVLISISVPLTGGLRSPMAVWYNLSIIAAALLLFRRGALAAASLSSLAYGTVLNLTYYGWLPASWVYAPGPPPAGLAVLVPIGANVASFFSVAALAAFLVERLARTERALEASEANLRKIEALQKVLVQNLESAVLTTDETGRIDSANRASAAVLGRAPEDLIGRKVVEIFPVLRSPVGPNPVLGPDTLPTEIRYRHPESGQERVLRCIRAPLTDTYENPIGMLFILQDVSALAALAAGAGNGSGEDRAATESPPPGLPGIVGQSSAIRAVIQMIEKVAPTDSTVLLTGESGTGKELAARAIHQLSPRRAKPWVVVNCAAIPENLIESELFGHVRGAYTGAIADRRGLFRTADGGTIFLDEIGDLPSSLQAKLLRVLQERSFTPVGGHAQVAVDVRIIAATNRDLEAEVARGRFREDLFYRLNVIRIEMPPLRERREDLPLLIRHFLGRFSEAQGKPLPAVSPRAMKLLLSYSYPGNIRELENVIEHAVALCGPEGIGEDDLPPKLREAGAAAPTFGSTEPLPSDLIDRMHARGSNLDLEIEEIERRFIAEALRRAAGVRKRAAEILGINYRSLRHRLAKYGFGEGGRELSDWRR